jgi:hypothetical protein
MKRHKILWINRSLCLYLSQCGSTDRKLETGDGLVVEVKSTLQDEVRRRMTMFGSIHYNRTGKDNRIFAMQTSNWETHE